MRTTSKTNLKKRAIAAAHDLSIVMRGKILLPGDDAYASSRQVWNGAVDHRPALFALCGNAQDVQAAVRVARSHGLPLSVRGGGHDWAGLALRHNGLVIAWECERCKERNRSETHCRWTTPFSFPLGSCWLTAALTSAAVAPPATVTSFATASSVTFRILESSITSPL